AALFVQGLVEAFATGAPVPPSPGQPSAFLFITAAAVAQVAWPEIRDRSHALMATVVDAFTLAAAISLWGSAGFFPFSLVAPGLSLSVLGPFAEILIPTMMSVVAVPQLAAHRRPRGIALAVAVG